MYPCAVLARLSDRWSAGPWSFVLGPWSVLWSKVLGPQVGPGTTLVFAALVIGAAFATVTAQRGAPPVPAPMAPVLRDYRAVTAERLKNPEEENWLMIRRTYDGWGFSPLTQITTANVARLRPVWVFSTAEARVHQAAPLVNGGVMFVTSPNNQVIAIDVKTGNLL